MGPGLWGSVLVLISKYLLEYSEHHTWGVGVGWGEAVEMHRDGVTCVQYRRQLSESAGC